MRRHVKEQLLNLAETILQAHDEIGTYICNGNITGAADMLAECQAAAVSIGTEIEESEGEGTETVSLLEQYCEALYGISVNIQNNPDNNKASKIVKKLNGYIFNVANMIRNNIEEKKEVLFLPYKASMWDSLESVWRAADNDTSCDAYVVPIPYFDKNPDGTFKKMHYEGESYPDYVPVVSWKEYNIAARHPDVIFIHNPYDGINKVTSVHPDYYSSLLKQYTDMLVYIPYFICLNDQVPKHFCVLPGTIHAHRVILQSEKVKQQYIEEFTTQMEKQNINVEAVFGDLNKKFLALGSPKVDKVVNTTYDMFDIPNEWKEKIGSGGKKDKLIILYNTTLQAFMDNVDRYFTKIKNTFDIFKNRNDVILLWRPHPLLCETIAAMYPDKLSQYKKIVEDYIYEDIGIYDDSSDVDRAIVLSDAYYGDMSSIVELYKMTGKPIMIQEINCLNVL